MRTLVMFIALLLLSLPAHSQVSGQAPASPLSTPAAADEVVTLPVYDTDLTCEAFGYMQDGLEPNVRRTRCVDTEKAALRKFETMPAVDMKVLNQCLPLSKALSSYNVLINCIEYHTTPR